MDIPACKTTRIYCRPNCPPGRRTLPQNRVWFASQKAARRVGYRPCKVCRPDLGDYAAWHPRLPSR